MESFSAEKYRVLESIFSSEEDIAWLESEPGYTPAIGRNLRAARRKLGREWIRELRAEFNRLYRQGQLMVLSSGIERPDLVQALWRSRWTFYEVLARLEIRLFLNSSTADEVRRLTTAFEHLIGYGWIAQEELALSQIGSKA
jgi:hypothetical protein